jgi:hypothetical protein
MNATEIGNAAGIVWRILDEGNKLPFHSLRDKTNLSDSILYSAIGWLFREGKIEVEHNSLTHEDVYFLPYCNMYY